LGVWSVGKPSAVIMNRVTINDPKLATQSTASLTPMTLALDISETLSLNSYMYMWIYVIILILFVYTSANWPWRLGYDYHELSRYDHA
jgi:preprotein translocase subunit SecY